MKKYVIAIAMVLTLSMNADAAAQNHRHTPRTEQVDSTKNNQDAIEAFSDTTGVADADNDEEYTTRAYSDDEVKGMLEQIGLDGEDIIGMVFVVVILLIMFVIAPITIIIAIFYFINKNRSEKYKLAQLAMKNGQPIPDQLLKEQHSNNYWEKNEYQSGIRQVFTGIGLAIFLGIIIGKLGVGIGALVFFIGLGKVFINWKSGDLFKKGQNDSPQMDNHSEIINN